MRGRRVDRPVRPNPRARSARPRRPVAPLRKSAAREGRGDNAQDRAINPHAVRSPRDGGAAPSCTRRQGLQGKLVPGLRSSHDRVRTSSQGGRGREHERDPTRCTGRCERGSRGVWPRPARRRPPGSSPRQRDAAVPFGQRAAQVAVLRMKRERCASVVDGDAQHHRRAITFRGLSGTSNRRISPSMATALCRGQRREEGRPGTPNRAGGRAPEPRLEDTPDTWRA